MKEIKPDRYVSLPDFKEPQLLLGACSDLNRNPTLHYDIARQQGKEAELRLLSSENYQALISGLNSSVSKPLLIEEVELPAQTAAIRFEEVFRVCSGDTEFLGTDPNVQYTESINYSGFQRKISDTGSKLVYVTETLESQDSLVTVKHPVHSTDSIAASYSGGSLQVAGAGGTSAEVTIQDLTYKSVVAAASANNITIQYLDAIPAAPATLEVSGIKFVAATAGEDGNDITIEMVDASEIISLGEESVAIEENAITFSIVPEQTTAALLVNLINTYDWGDDPVLVTAELLSASAVQAVLEETNLSGGTEMIGAAGSEVVTVSGQDIQIRLQSEVSTATQIKAAIDGSADALKLISVLISGTETNPQSAPIGPIHLDGGQDVEANLKLGEIELSENGEALQDGTAVEISYETQRYTVYRIRAGAGKDFYIAKISMLEYLSDNAAS